jgi:hypothetical protein
MARELVFGKYIDLDEFYMVYFSDDQRKLSKEDLEEYQRIQAMEHRFKYEMLANLPPQKNPHVLPVTGRELITLCRSKKLIPMMDAYEPRKVSLVPAPAMDFYFKYSRQIGGVH